MKYYEITVCEFQEPDEHIVPHGIFIRVPKKTYEENPEFYQNYAEKMFAKYICADDCQLDIKVTEC